MGNFYCNHTTVGPDSSEVVRVLAKYRRSAYVTPTLDGKTIVFDEAADELNIDHIDACGELLSRELACVVLAVAVADDDELCWMLYEEGERRAAYSTRHLSSGILQLARAFGKSRSAWRLWTILNWPFVLFEFKRHARLARLLGIPDWCVATGYRYIQQGEGPIGLETDQMIKVTR